MSNFPHLKNPFILAPMAGITDVAFRLMCKKYGASLVFTEMVSANALSRNNKATIKLLESTKEEKPVGVQLFGQNTENLVKVAKIIQDNYNFDLIDINCGCPAVKIIKEGAGSALMNRPNKIGEMVSEITKNVDLPVTVKIRAGINFKNINCVEIAKIAELSGASAITIHGRTAIQGYGGKADWKYISDVKNSVSIPVIGNGDAMTPESALKMISETKCDYVMIGRAARGNAFIFKQCVDYMNDGKYDKKIDNKKEFLKYLELAQKFYINFKAIKVQANYFTKGIIGGAKIREKIQACKDVDDIRGLF